MTTKIGVYDSRFQLGDDGPKTSITLSDAFSVTLGADNADVDLDLGAIEPTSVDTGSGAITTTGTVSAGTVTGGSGGISSTGTIAGAVVTPTKLTLAATSTLTIATGAVTATKSYHKIDTEGAGASDDLDTINGGAVGEFLVLQSVADARDVVVKHGTGNIFLASGADVTLGDSDDRILLISDGTNWLGIASSINHS